MKSRRPFLIAVMLALLGALLLARSYGPMRGTSTDQPVAALYDPDPNHIWNRVYDSLLVRRSADGAQYGFDTVDPLLWANTKFLRERRSRRLALECLDEFLKTHAERRISDPTRRAVFQHDLWAVFDWAASPGSNMAKNQALLMRIAEVMRRVALRPDQISALPDTYSEGVASHDFPAEYDSANPQRAFLPPDLLRPDGPWICLTGHSDKPTAIMHFSGRSRFTIFLKLPGGRQATLEYLRKLFSSPEPLFVQDVAPNNRLLNLRLPQFPVGTEVALLRQMIVIDTDGNLVPTTLTESLQLRVYHAVTSGSPYVNNHSAPSIDDQDFFEFRFARPALFARRSGSLLGVQPRETEFPTLFSFGIDPFETSRKDDWWLKRPGEILGRCPACHADAGIHSVVSREQWLGPHSRLRQSGWEEPCLSCALQWETDKTIERKQREHDFRILLRYWQRPS